ncbi:MAG TPA: methyltransferase domain-containing protein [Saprospiraceae bacterium]|nr:methyltransferase domain-containing protein [Saprospiraceae bacterium]
MSQTKVHFAHAQAIVNCLFEIFQNDRKASKAIEYQLKQNKNAGSRDRAFIAETTYEIVRYWRLLRAIDLQETQAIDTSSLWRIVAIYLNIYQGFTLHFDTISKIDFKLIKQRLSHAEAEMTLKESIPDWLNEIGIQDYNNEWPTLLHALNVPAEVYLRVNTLKTTASALKKELQNQGIETQIIDVDALVVVKRKNLFSTEAFQNGLFEVQDIGSQQISKMLHPLPGMRVIDACAGAGGKTLHIANLMENKGSIISLDVAQFKLDELKKRARRNGVFNVETRLIEPRTIKKLKESADRLLLDVPCSGLGVLRRNPDAKWKQSPQSIQEVMNIQKEILNNYPKMLKPGGMMVYATCSICKSENEHQLHAFLSENSNYQLVTEKTLLPDELNSDAFYMALIKKL